MQIQSIKSVLDTFDELIEMDETKSVFFDAKVRNSIKEFFATYLKFIFLFLDNSNMHYETIRKYKSSIIFYINKKLEKINMESPFPNIVKDPLDHSDPLTQQHFGY